MILIAIGSNKPGPWGTPEQNVVTAIGKLGQWPLRLVKASAHIVTAPFGKINQANFVNAVVQVETSLSPHALLSHLHTIEKNAGRKRGIKWGPRTLDLDIIDYHGRILPRAGSGVAGLELPHPGIAQRTFVLMPIAEIAPRWRHPELHLTAPEMLGRLAN